MKIFLLAVAVCIPSAIWAQEIKPFDAKLGLWENSVTTEIAGMPAMPAMPAISEETLAKMPPAQRAQLEAAMKGRGGIGTPRATVVKSCITRETLNRSLYDGDKNCTTKLVSSTPTVQKIHMDCSGGTKMSGDLTMERVDAEHMKGTMLITGSEGGRTVDMKMTMSNKWLSADCGNVKPLGEK